MSGTDQGIALYDYQAVEEDEISIQKGEVFFVVETYDDDWWLVEINNQQGLIPSNYVRMVSENENEAMEPEEPVAQMNPKQKSSSKLRLQQLQIEEDEETILSPPKLDFESDSHDNIELSRLKELREEATAKIDALRVTLTSYENNNAFPSYARTPKGMPPNNNMIVSPKKASQQRQQFSDDTTSNSSKIMKSPSTDATEVVIKKDNSKPSLMRRVNSEKKINSKPIQQVMLDPTSIEYISKVIHDKIQREFTMRDQRLLGQVEEIIHSTLNSLSSQGQLTPSIPPMEQHQGPIVMSPKKSMFAKQQGGRYQEEDAFAPSRGAGNASSSAGNTPSSAPQPGENMDYKQSTSAPNSRGHSKIPKIRLPKVPTAAGNVNTNGNNNASISSRSSGGNGGSNIPSLPSIPKTGKAGGIGGGGGNGANTNSNRNNPKDVDLLLSLDGMQYAHCRSMVYPSVDDLESVRSAYQQRANPLRHPTKASLGLKHVIGYDGDPNRHGNAIRGKNILHVTVSVPIVRTNGKIENKEQTFLAYPAASVVVLMNIHTQQQFFFTGHSDDVTCLVKHPTLPYIASSQIGSDCSIFIWNFAQIVQEGYQRLQGLLTAEQLNELETQPGCLNATMVELCLPGVTSASFASAAAIGSNNAVLNPSAIGKDGIAGGVGGGIGGGGGRGDAGNGNGLNGNGNNVNGTPTVRGISHLDFSPDGRLLLACSIEETKQVYIYDWKTKMLLIQQKIGFNNVDSIGQYTFNPYCYTPFFEEASQGGNQLAYRTNYGCYTLISYGGKQVKFWTLKKVMTNRPKDNREKVLRPPKANLFTYDYVLEGNVGIVKKPTTNHHANNAAAASEVYTCCHYIKLTDEESRILVGTSTGSIQIWKHQIEDVAGYDDNHTQGHGNLSWLSKGKLLLIISDAHEAPIVEMDFLPYITPITIHASPNRNKGHAASAQASPQSKQYAGRLATSDHNGIIHLWNVNSSKAHEMKVPPLEHIGAVEIEESYARSIVWNATHATLPSASSSNTANASPAKSNQKGMYEEIVLGMANNSIALLTLQYHSSHPPNNQLTSFQLQPILISHNGKVKKLSMHPLLSSCFASICSDKTVRIWYYTRQHRIQQLALISLETMATAISFSSGQDGGKTVAIGNERGELLVLQSVEFEEFLSLHRSLQEDVGSYSEDEEATMIDSFLQQTTNMEWKLLDSRVIGSQPSGNNAGGNNNKNMKKFEITEIKYSPLGDLIAIGCKDNSIHLLSITKGYRKVAVCRGHTSPIKQLDFSSDGKILKSNDILSKELLFWEVDTGSRISNHLVYRDIPWYTMSCIYGWSLQGIFNRYNSIQEKFLPVENDVNCISKCPHTNIMAVSSSFTGHSSIKLFSYPVVPDAIPKYYGGHTSPVVDLAFVSMYQGSQLYLFSAGGNDSCIFIWDVRV